MSKKAHQILTYAGLINSFLFFVFIFNKTEMLDVLSLVGMVLIIGFQISITIDQFTNKSEEMNVNDNKK